MSQPLCAVPPADPKERLTVAGVLSHPWCNLQPSTLSYNDLQIAKSMANAPSQKVGYSIIRQAFGPPTRGAYRPLAEAPMCSLEYTYGLHSAACHS